MPAVFMVNPKRNKAGQFVKGSRRAKPAAKARHVTKKRAKPRAAAAKKRAAPRAAAAKKTTRHIVIDMGGRKGLVKAKKGVYTVNPKRKHVTKKRKSAAAGRSTRRVTTTKRKHHRRNPKGQLMSVLKGAMLPAMIFPTAAIAGDVLYGVLPLPASMRTGMMKPVGQLGIAALLGALGSFVLPARYATLVAGGLIGGVMYDMGKGFLQTQFPALPLSGGAYDYPGLEYEGVGAAPSFLGNTAPSFLGDGSMGPVGEYTRQSDNVSAYVGAGE